MKEWKVSEIEDAKYLGIIEFQIEGDDEWVNFTLLETKDRLVFGGTCNTGFMESGYMELDDCFPIDEELQELMEELEVYYRDGKGYTNRIVCNERM